MTSAAPVWVDAAVAVLLVLSGASVLISALGFWRARDFFQRIHPPALAYTLGSWSASLAGILYFSIQEQRPVLHPWLIVVLLCITVPVTTVLLARVALFRLRTAGAAEAPPPLSGPRNPD